MPAPGSGAIRSSSLAIGILCLTLVCLLPATAYAQVVMTPGAGSDPVVLVMPADGNTAKFFAYDPSFRGGVRAALGDVNGDGILDIITGPGPGGGPLVRVWSGVDYSELASFFAFDPAFAGGVFVAAGDVNGDGRADIITGAGPGGAPMVKAFSGADMSELASFSAYDPAFAGGVFVAAGDVNGDGRADIITGAGAGGGPLVKVMSGADLSELASFFAYDPAFAGGVSVAAGDVNGDNRADIITGPGPGIGPLVRVLNGADFSELASFFAYDPAVTGSVFVGVVDVDGDGRPEIVTGAGPGSAPHVRILRVDANDRSELADLFPFDLSFTGGVFVASDGGGVGLRFTSPNAASFTAGAAGAFTVTTAGSSGSVALTVTGTLPGGVTFTDNGDGTATLEGTPDPGTGGTYPLTFTATPALGTPVTQNFTLTVNEAPAITSANAITFNVGAAGSFTVTTTGFPQPAVSLTGGTLPAGVTFQDNGDGTATLGGTPAAGTADTYVLEFTAANGVTPDAVQAFTLTVTQLAVLAIADVSQAETGGPTTFVFTVSLSEPAPPGGVTFDIATADGTATAASGDYVAQALTGQTIPAGSSTYTFTVTVNGDATAEADETFQVIVSNVTGAAVADGTAVGTIVNDDDPAPAITSANATTFTVGVAGSFTVTATGFPLPSLTRGGVALPAGVTFVDNGDGTGTLSGTPDAGTGGTYAITFTAANGVPPDAVQNFTLTVNEAPVITSANATTFTVGVAGSFTVATTGFPAPAITRGGVSLPSGVTFVDNGNGTGTLAGTPDPLTGGTYAITFTATNVVGSSGPQNFTLTVNQAPAITSATATSFTIGVAGSFTVTTTGFPVPSLAQGGALPAGVTFVDNLNGTGTLSGTPEPGTGGTYPLTFTATNGVGSPATQNFSLMVVDPRPVITAGGTLNYIEGNAATAIDTGILVTDPDSLTLAFATVQITGNYVNGQDVLGFAPAFGIVGVFVPATGTLTLSGSSSVGNYQAALRTVTYFNNSATPSILPRTVTWRVSDGTNLSNPAFSTITVTAVNSAPIGVTDSWTTFGNTDLVVDQAGPSTPFVADTTTSTFGVLDNDSDPENDARVVSGIVGCLDTSAPYDCSTTAGGSVTMESNGRFTYRPQAGDTGADSFQYVLTDVPLAGLPASVNVTVNLMLLERIWYVDGNVAGPGTGTSSDPFNALPATAGDANDFIFVHDSTLGGSITLQNGQKLYGEGFGLSINQALNGNPAPTVLVAPGTNPVINATSGNAVGVLANTANGSLTNVEIRGLTLSTTGASSNAIDVTSADAANVGVTISNVEVTAATAEGIDINQASSGSATVAISNVTVTSAGTGIDLNETAGALTITAFSDLEVSGATGGTGIAVNGATFDTTPGGAFDQVAGGTTVVGDGANGVGGAGMLLTNVSGDLAFTDLDILTDNGAGLRVTGTGPVNVGAGTGTRVTVAPLVASFTANVGPVVDITNATVDLPLSSASASSSPTTAISLVNVSGGTTSAAFSAASGIILNTTGVSFNVSGGDATISYGGNITHVSATAMVSVSGHTGGAITFSGALSASSGTGLQFDNADGTYTFTGTTTLNGGDAGIDILNGSAGAFGFGTGTAITNPSGTAFLLSGSNANVTYSGSINDGTGFAVDIDNHDAGTMTFQTGAITSAESGIRIANSNGGTINFNNPTIALTTGPNKAVTLDTSNAGGTVNFNPAGGNGLDISTTTGTGFSALGGGTISVTGAGNTITASTGAALDMQGVTIGAGGLNFATTMSGGGANSVKLASVTGGAIALGTGSLSGATAAAFLVGDGAGTANTGGTAAITYGGTITTTGSSRPVNIQDRAPGAGNITLSGTITHASGNASGIFMDDNAAGTITFSGANSVLNSGFAAAVSLTDNTGATINFTGGGLDIDATSGGGFVATGGGTVTVMGTVNTIATASGTALNLSGGTTIGASGLTFQSINQTGGSNGIVLNGTGATGFLMVSGDGSTTGGLLDRDGSGGTITATSGHAVALTNASNVTLRQMNITNTSGATADGINGSGGGNLTILAAHIDDPGGHGVNLTNITGVNTINQNTRIENFNTLTKSGIEIRNTGTNFTSITIGTNTAVNDDTKILNSVTGSDGILFVAMGATTGTVTVQNMEFTNLDQDAVQIANDGSGTITSVIRSSNFHDADTTSGDGNNTVFLSQAGSGDHNFTIGGSTAAEGNSFTNLGRLGVLAGVVQVNVNGPASAGGQVNGTIQQNTISGSTGRRGIMFLAEASGGAQGGHTVSILDNTVSNTFHGSIYVIFSALNNSDNLGNSLTVSRNNVNTTLGNSGGDSASAIEIETAFGGTPSDVAATIMLEDNIAVNNTTSGLGDTIEIVNRGDVVGATGTFNVTAWGNTATNNAGGTNSAFEIRNFASAGGTLTMTLDLNAANIAANRNNFSAGQANITNDAGATTYNIEGMALGAQTAAAVDTFLSARNDGAIAATGSFVGVANGAPLFFEPAADASIGMPSVATAQSTDARMLSQADRDSLIDAAIRRWVETGLTDAQSAMLRRLRFEVADLPGSYLAEAVAELIRVDRNAGRQLLAHRGACRG